MKIRIPVLVGANGRWFASGGNEDDAPDWAFMEEQVLDFIGATVQDANISILHVWVEVDVPLPVDAVVTGSAIYKPT